METSKLLVVLLSISLILAELYLTEFGKNFACFSQNTIRAIDTFDTSGKDAIDVKSKFSNALLLRNFDDSFQEVQPWKIVSSVENSTLFDLYPTTDFRWEHFISNGADQEGNAADFLLNQQFPVDYKLSLSLYPIATVNSKILVNFNSGVTAALEVNPEQELGKQSLVGEDYRWIHFRLHGNQSGFYTVFSNEAFSCGRQSDFRIDNGNADTYNVSLNYRSMDKVKVHKYNFLWTDVSGVSTLISQQVKTSLPCISLFCVKCKTCSMEFVLSTQDYSYNFFCRNECPHTWRNELFCYNSTSVSEVKLEVVNKKSSREENGFWAVDDIYLIERSLSRQLNLSRLSKDTSCNFADHRDSEPIVKLSQANEEYRSQCGPGIKDFCRNSSCHLCCISSGTNRCFSYKMNETFIEEKEAEENSNVLIWILVGVLVLTILGLAAGIYYWVCYWKSRSVRIKEHGETLLMT